MSEDKNFIHDEGYQVPSVDDLMITLVGAESKTQGALNLFAKVGEVTRSVLIDQLSSNAQLRGEFAIQVIAPLMERYNRIGDDQQDLVVELQDEFDFLFGKPSRDGDDGGLVGSGLKIVGDDANNIIGMEKLKEIKRSDAPVEGVSDTINRFNERLDHRDSGLVDVKGTPLDIRVSDKFIELEMELRGRLEKGDDIESDEVLQFAANLIKTFGETNIDSGWVKKWRLNWRGLREILDKFGKASTYRDSD